MCTLLYKFFLKRKKNAFISPNPCMYFSSSPLPFFAFLSTHPSNMQENCRQ